MVIKGLLILAQTAVLLWVMALIGCKTPLPPPPPLANSGSPEVDVLGSYLVQNSLRTTRHKPVVSKLTVPFVAWPSASFSEDCSKHLPVPTKDIPEDLIRDFCEKNSSTNRVLISGDLTNHVAALLVSDDALGSLFAFGMPVKPDGWDKFYHRYPEAGEMTHFSRVGFNKAGDMAMVYTHTTFHWLVGGSGRVVVFEKHDNRWVILPVFWAFSVDN